MVGQSFWQRWITVLVCLSFSGVQSQAVAKQMSDPDLLMSETGLMLLVIDDLPGTMIRSKTFFDGVYKEYREQGVLGPLQTPMTQFVFQHANDDQPKHWFLKAVDSIAQEGTELEKTWRPIADKLAEDPNEITPEDEDLVIAAFARLFDGKMFIGEEDYKPYRSTIFGFEYDPKSFDWMKELRLVAERQRERYGYENRSITVSGVNVIHLPHEGWYVFSVENVIYGVVERELEKTKTYIDRILYLRNGQPPVWEALRSARRFQRGVAINDKAPLFSSDGFLYINANRYFKRGTQDSTSLQHGNSEINAINFPDISWCSSGYLQFAIDESGNELKYCIKYPMLLPVEGPPKALVEEFEGFAAPESIRMSESDKCLSIRQPRGPVLSRVVTWQNHHYLLPQRLWFSLTNDDNESSRESDDLLEHFRRALEHITPNVPITVVSTNYAWDEYLLVANGICIQTDLVGSVANFMHAVNHVPFDLRFGDFNAQGIRRIGRFVADEIVLFGSEKLEVDTKLQRSARFQILDRRRLESSEIYFVGAGTVEFMIIEKNGYLSVYSCQSIPKERLDSLVFSVVNSSDRTIVAKPQFMNMLNPKETVLELLYHRAPESRDRNIGLFSFIGNSGMNELRFDLRLMDGDDFSLAYCIWAVFASLTRPENDQIELDWNISRASSIDCFQAVLRRDDSLIHLGSMMLPEE